MILYAITIASIFSLLFEFYLNRQQAHYQDYALNKEKLLAFAMAKRTCEKAISENGEQSFNVGKSTYRNDEKFFTTTIDTGKNKFEFHFSPLKKPVKSLRKQKTSSKKEMRRK